MRSVQVFLLAIFLPTNLFAREDTDLDTGWRFNLAEVTNAAQMGFDDSGWQTIALPHNWGWEEAQQGKGYYRGPGWYRRELNIGAPAAGRRYYLRFEAASTVADVYLNGTLLGEHRGGFGAFCFEITRALSADGTNTLAVRVSNRAEPDIAPLSGDFSVYGGLYRSVHLIETPDVNITPMDHGSPGVAWQQTHVTTDAAALDVTAQVSNGARGAQPVTLIARVMDANGRVVATNSQEIRPAGTHTAPYYLHLSVNQPHLWNGRADPYLYHAVVELRSAEGVLDSVTQPLGLRFYSVDPDHGFFLNGRPYHLHGVDRHQDRQGKGWAISEADQEEDLRLITEMGCTVIRCAHYEHSDYFYSLCDKAGILVWAEIPQVNEINASPQFEETSRNQLLDLIRQNVNHPSIFAWSIFNEISTRSPDPHRELQDLRDTAHGEDPSRPVIAATSTAQLPQMNKLLDLLGWNIYPGWYSGWGTKDDFGKSLDDRRHDSRSGGFCVSEYGAGANVTQHEDNPKQPATTGQWHPEEWQALVHEAAWPAMKARPFVWGTFVWCMFDFAVSSRHEGNIPGRNDKGLVTYDRKIKKDAFYYYKANWTEEPMVYITSRRFTERTNAVTNVKIYSNATEVELLLNGVSQGRRADGTNCVFIWPNVTLTSGGNRVEARASRDGKAAADNCVWSLK